MFGHRVAQEELARQLITHLMGFEEGEANFERSLQYVCSNLYHHTCLAPDQRQLKQQVSGVLLKLSVHGLAQTRDRLEVLVDRYTQPAVDDPQGEEVRWSVLALLLHLSHNPTNPRLLPHLPSPSPEPEEGGANAVHRVSASLTEEELVQLLLQETEPVAGGRDEDALSDWSAGSSDGDQPAPVGHSGSVSKPHRRSRHRHHSRRGRPNHVAVKASEVNDCSTPTPLSQTTLQSQAQAAEHWLRDHTHQQRTDTTGARVVTERELVRETLQALVWSDVDGLFADTPATDTLSQSSVLSALEGVHQLAGKLRTLHGVPVGGSVGRAYTAALHSWRGSLNAQLLALLEKASDTGFQPTLVWLLSSLEPVLTSVSLHCAHTTALQQPDACPRLQQLRLLCALVEGVECAVTCTERSELLQLLLHCLQPLLLCLHHTAHQDPHSLLYRNPSIDVKSSLFWSDAYAERQDFKLEAATVRGSEVVLQLLSTISNVAKTRELLSALQQHQLEDSPGRGASPADGGFGTTPPTDDRGEAAMQQVLTQLEQLNASSQPRPSRDSISDTLHDLLQGGQGGVGGYDPFLARYGRPPRTGNTVGEDSSSEDEQTPKKNVLNVDETKSIDFIAKFTNQNYSLNIICDDKISNKYTNETAGSHHRHSDTRGIKSCNKSFNPHQQTLGTAAGEEEDGGSAAQLKRRLLALSCPRPLTGSRLLSLVGAGCTASHSDVTRAVADQLYSHFSLARHVSCLCSVMLLQPTNIMSSFTSSIFNKCFAKQKLNAMDLTLKLHECIEKLFPDLVDNFSVIVVKQRTTARAAKDATVVEQSNIDVERDPSDNEDGLPVEDDDHIDEVTRLLSGEDVDGLLSDELWQSLGLNNLDQFETHDLADLQIRYQVGWPLDSLLPGVQLDQYNAVLQFCLRLQQALHALNALNFKDMGGWELVEADCPVLGDGGDDESSLHWCLHRLQLLRHWLLFFCRTLHDHFTTCVIMPFCNALHDMLERKPPLHEFIADHDRLLKELRQQCLLSSGARESPVQLALKKVVGVVSEVCSVWRCGGVGAEQLSALESSYAACHRFLLRLLRMLAGGGGAAAPAHLSGLIDALASSCPVNV